MDGGAMRMNVTNLRSFLAVAEYGGFTAAAERLGVAQPTLTRQVRELEDRHGVQLFERSTRHVRLTQAGEDLYAIARRAFSELETAERFLADRSRRKINIFSVRNERLPALIAAIHGHLHAPDVAVTQMSSGGVYDGLLSGDCDIGLLTVPDGATDVDALEIGRYPVIAYLSPSHLLRSRQRLCLHDLEGQRVAIGTRATQTRRTFDRELARHKVQCATIQEVDDYDVLYAMAQAGYAVGIAGSTGRTDPREREAIGFEEEGMAQALHIAAPRREKRTPVGNALFELAKPLLLADS